MRAGAAPSRTTRFTLRPDVSHNINRKASEVSSQAANVSSGTAEWKKSLIAMITPRLGQCATSTLSDKDQPMGICVEPLKNILVDTTSQDIFNAFLVIRIFEKRHLIGQCKFNFLREGAKIICTI